MSSGADYRPATRGVVVGGGASSSASAASSARAGGAARSSYPFRADLDLAELDERRRPGQPWSGRGVELSRSSVTFKSRRLCYDDRPVALFGVVSKSDYEGDGQYRTVVALREMPEHDAVAGWAASLTPRNQSESGTMR
jgi:hypothetical protein